MVRVARLAAVAALLAVTACSAAHPAHRASPAPSRPATATAAPAPAPPAMPQPGGPPPVPGANYATGGCGPRPLLSGARPAWTASANPPALIYVLGRHRQIAGFLFGFPLMAGHADLAPAHRHRRPLVRPAPVSTEGRGQSSPMSAASPPVTLSSSANVVG